MFKDKSFLVAFSIFSGAVLIVLLSLILGSIGYGKDLAFYLLATITLVSAVGVVTLPNLVYSGFLLVLTFVNIAGIYSLLNADFLAAAQILINGGAVTIMLIFGIWLTNNRADTSNLPYSGTYRYVAFVFVGLGLFLVLLLRMTGINLNFGGGKVLSQTSVLWPINQPVSTNTTEQIGQMFFNQYLVPFEVASVILLMALIGAIVLAMKDTDLREIDIQGNYPTEPVDIHDTNEAQTFPLTSRKQH